MKSTKTLVIGFAILFTVSAVLGFFKLNALIFPLVIFFMIFLGLSRTLSGNKSEKKASPEERTAALQPCPDAQKASIYVYREGFVGKALGLNFLIDDREVVQLKSPRFSVIRVAAGTHQIAVSANNTTSAETNPRNFEARSGEVIVFKLSLKMGGLRNAIVVTRDPDQAAAIAKFASMPLIASIYP